MRRYLFGSFLLATLLVVVACEGDEGASATHESEAIAPSADLPAGWVQYELNGVDATVDLPLNWELDTSGKMNTAMIAFSPQDSTDDYFRENINLNWEDVSGQGLTIDGYMENAKGTIQQFVTDLSDFELEKREGDYWITYKGRQGSFEVAYHQRLMMRAEKAYVLNYTSIVGKPSSHDSVATEILQRFQLN